MRKDIVCSSPFRLTHCVKYELQSTAVILVFQMTHLFAFLYHFRRRSLSSHFFGKSRSFTSLGDVASAQSIQDLAKPERPKRRRNSLSDCHSDRLRSFEPSISKKECGRGTGGRMLAMALAMSAGEAGGWGMETLQEA